MADEPHRAPVGGQARSWRGSGLAAAGCTRTRVHVRVRGSQGAPRPVDAAAGARWMVLGGWCHGWVPWV
eukprot:scaffold109270_cov24-Phaeocystis_antarctica.AAC.1